MGGRPAAVRDAARAAEDDPAATFAEAWAAVGEMGVPTIGLPESAGGGGGTTLDVAVALEACAHELVPGPLLGPTVAAAVLGDARRERGASSGLVLGDVVWDAPSATHLLLADGDRWCVVPRAAADASSARPVPT